ncbi:YcaO-like family protein [Curtobacterium sp. PhB78]|uniref:YcaO-like family protein n=1 Tax=Curtobacterium sp. PhB78 TaxID=2485102 RepID=UPI000FB0D06E|nr:YcaO-like family protein [Curtobacterium sp. PhB78]ROS45983.1 ribosomal protein S12 methylthiotransferase accessory factor [Curtobacterium sp. PhB78]
MARESVHPFLSTFVDAFASGTPQDGYTAVGRHDLVIHRGAVVHRSQCSRAPRARRPLKAESGGYRANHSKAFFAADLGASELSNPVSGIVSASTDEDIRSLVTAKVAGFFVERDGHGEYVRSWGGHSDSYAHSRDIGLLEGIERLSCAEPDDCMVVESVPEEVDIIRPEEFGVDLATQIDPREIVAAWTLGHDLSDGRTVAVPARLVFYAARLAEPVWVQDSSSGCAVGGDDQEAQLFGLLEAIERDAFLLAWYGDLPLRQIDTSTVCDPESIGYIARLRLIGIDVRFFDATVGIDVPTVIAVCSTASDGVCFGAGSHPEPARALRSALIEVASDFQVVEDHVRQHRERLLAMFEDPNKVAAVDDHADLYGLREARSWLTHWANPDTRSTRWCGLDELQRASAPGTSITGDLGDVIAAVVQAGFSPIAVDVASSVARSYGLACWKVLVPGLLPLDFGWPEQRALSMPRLSGRGQEWLDAHAPPGTALRVHRHPHPFP